MTWPYSTVRGSLHETQTLDLDSMHFNDDLIEATVKINMNQYNSDLQACTEKHSTSFLLETLLHLELSSSNFPLLALQIEQDFAVPDDQNLCCTTNTLLL